MAIAWFAFLAGRVAYSASTQIPPWEASITGTGELVGAVGSPSFVELFNIRDKEASCFWSLSPPGVDHDNVSSNTAATVVEAVAGVREVVNVIPSPHPEPDIAPLWAASYSELLGVDSGTPVPCQASGILFMRSSSLIISWSSHSHRAVNPCYSSGFHFMICWGAMICPSRSNSSSSVCSNCLSCSVHTPPFNCKTELAEQDIFPSGSVSKFEPWTKH